ncbi:hypothetical protein [Trichlorobacter lovleyi]|uniref:hypothetical protein n=1 Tax=Trichlorobacter lovleyi TaxID=313985 RepID=UPI003D0B0FED
MQLPELHAGRYLTESDYNSFLLSSIAMAGPGFDREFAKQELQGWHATYSRNRRIERALELLVQQAGKTACLAVHDQYDIEQLADLAECCPFHQLSGFSGVLATHKSTGGTPFPVFTRSEIPANIEVMVSLDPDQSAPAGFKGQMIANDFRQAFVDMKRFEGLIGVRFRYPDRQLILYADYRNGTNLSTLAGSINDKYGERFVTVGLLSGSADGRRYTHAFVEPLYYLWPMALLLARPDILHLNVGAGTQGLVFALFASESQHTVIDFYDVLSFVPDRALEQGHYATLSATRNADRYLFERFDYFIHKCSAWVSTELQQKFAKEQVVQVIEFAEEPMYGRIEDRPADHVRLVYGGLMLNDDREPEDSHFKRTLLAMAGLYAQQHLELYLYPTPYLYGFQKNLAIEAMIERYQLANLHNCSPLREDDFIREAAQYDFAAIHVTLPEQRPMTTGYIFPAKFLTYLRAGLPIVVPEDLTCVAELVEQHKIGVVFRYDDSASLPALLLKQDIRQLKENVYTFRQQLTLDKGLAKVMGLYERMLSGENNEA